MLDVAVVFGTVNRYQLLRQCVESTRRAARELSYRILACDGGSIDETRDYLAHQGDCELLEGGLSGFVRAMNVGTARAVDLEARSVCIFNDDLAFVEPDTLDRAFEALERYPDVGAVAFPCDRYTKGAGFAWELWDGMVYCNQGLVRLEAGMAVARASGDPSGRKWFSEAYHTYWSDNHFGLSLGWLGYRIHLAPELAVHDEYSVTGSADPLRKRNLAHIAADEKTFRTRWPTMAAANYDPRAARRYGGLVHETPPPPTQTVDGMRGHSFLRASAPRRGVVQAEPAPRPSVSCLMVTHHGQPLAAEAIAQFKAQDYAGKLELVVVDNGERPIRDLCDGDPRIVYDYIEPGKLSLGALRNRAHGLSTGDITVEWDDDDWRAPGYVAALVQALLDNPNAHFSAMVGPHRVQFLPSGEMRLWRASFLHDCSLCIWRDRWVPFTEGKTVGEKVDFVEGKQADGGFKHPRAEVARPDLMVYRVHGRNAWATREKLRKLEPLPWNLRAPAPVSDRGIVTISGARYFPQLRLMLGSLFEHTSCPVKVFDIGLEPGQVAELARVGIETFKAPASAERFVEEGAKAGSRYAWAKAFVIRDAPLWKRTLWIDSDTYVLKSLEPLFEMLDRGPVITPALFSGPTTHNPEELYERLPVKARTPDLSINAGVMGYDRERDADIIDAWCGLVERVFAEPGLKPLIRWYDQGALIWAVQSIGRADVVLKVPTWNRLADGNTAGRRASYHSDRLAEEIAAAHPDAAIVHWAGLKKLDALLLPPVPPKPLTASTAAPPPRILARPKLRVHHHRRRA